MSRSQYNTALEYSADQGIVTFFVKSGNWAGHAMLTIEAKEIIEGGDLLVFDFMQKAKAIQLAQQEEKNVQSLLEALLKLSQNVLTPANLIIAAHTVIDSLRGQNRGSYHQVISALRAILNESADIAKYVKEALKTSSETVASSVVGMFMQDVGVIRSSHPLDAKNMIQKIRVWEFTPGLDEKFHSFKVSHAEINKMIENIRAEESKPRPFQFFGKQWSASSNCMDWTLEKLRLMHSCTPIVKIAWTNSGKVATPDSVCSALIAASRAQSESSESPEQKMGLQ